MFKLLFAQRQVKNLQKIIVKLKDDTETLEEVIGIYIEENRELSKELAAKEDEIVYLKGELEAKKKGWYD